MSLELWDDIDLSYLKRPVVHGMNGTSLDGMITHFGSVINLASVPREEMNSKMATPCKEQWSVAHNASK